MPTPGTAAFERTVVGDDPSQLIDLIRRVIGWLGVTLVLDVGAHHGEFGRWLRDDVGYVGPVVSFEPNPESFARLVQTVGADPVWTCRRLALGERQASVELHRFDRSNFDSLGTPTAALGTNFDVTEIGTVAVEVVRLDDIDPAELAAEKPVTLLKIDTQGHDIRVLDGAAEWLGRSVAVLMELSVDPLYATSVTIEGGLRYMRERGFVPAGLFPVTRDPGHLAVVEFDGLFVRR